jgi:lipoprotein-anchoring transpeptidase ErfK/SrfK
MTRVPRLLMYLMAAATALGPAWATEAQADPEAGLPYIYVSKQVPQRLYVIDGGKIVFQSPANTGIRVSPTPDGEFRVFASFVQRTMKGTDPVTFKPYNDPNVPFAMYFDGGRAIHGFPRHGYGYPQSFGCIELPVSKARELYGLLQGGLDTEVVVASHPPVLDHSHPSYGQRPAGPVLTRREGTPITPYPTDDRLAEDALPAR